MILKFLRSCPSDISIKMVVHKSIIKCFHVSENKSAYKQDKLNSQKCLNFRFSLSTLMYSTQCRLKTISTFLIKLKQNNQKKREEVRQAFVY